ncbi:MAG: hypothetical protein LQ351_008055 [Letrouitia transgressa]|nr:MAG: hypothetical protein LQ351_008055 [Letrouitia transgressa]
MHGESFNGLADDAVFSSREFNVDHKLSMSVSPKGRLRRRLARREPFDTERAPMFSVLFRSSWYCAVHLARYRFKKQSGCSFFDGKKKQKCARRLQLSGKNTLTGESQLPYLESLVEPYLSYYSGR